MNHQFMHTTGSAAHALGVSSGYMADACKLSVIICRKTSQHGNWEIPETQVTECRRNPALFKARMKNARERLAMMR